MMANFMIGASGFILTMTALGLARILWGPSAADRLMSAQLLGTGAIAALLLIAVASETSAVVDVALTFALLAAFVSIAFVRGAPRVEQNDAEIADR